MNRRNLLLSILGTTALATTFLSGKSSSAQAPQSRRNRDARRRRTLKKYDNSHFYSEDGVFNAEAAKQAYAELLRFHGFPSAQQAIDDPRFFAIDFGLGDFANVGMGGIVWVNNKDQGYFGHEMFLLPLQMIPEHAHFAAEGKPAKHECWQVRHGSIVTFGEGGSKDGPFPIRLPQSQLDAEAITVFDWKEIKAGMGPESEAALNRPEAFHFMIGGPNGAIVTEYGSFQSGEGLKLQNSNAKM